MIEALVHVAGRLDRKSLVNLLSVDHSYRRLSSNNIVHTILLQHIRSEDNHALRSASYYGRLEVVKYLVSCGLTVEDIRSENNQALCLSWASENGHLKVIKYLEDFIRENE